MEEERHGSTEREREREEGFSLLEIKSEDYGRRFKI